MKWHERLAEAACVARGRIAPALCGAAPGLGYPCRLSKGRRSVSLAREGAERERAPRNMG